MESAFNKLNFNKSYELLIVDDIPDNLQLLSNILYEKNLGISIATSGMQALEILNEKQFDLILLDISMPEMSGFDVCERIRADERTKEIPVIFLTARTDIQSITKGFLVGGQDYVTKPFNNQELLARVKNHLELKDKKEELKELNAELEAKVAERTAQLEYANIQLENANESLLEANHKLAKLDKAKNEFLLLINHELRTPLHSLRGMLGILGDVVNSPNYSEYLDTLNKSADKLVRLSEMALLITSLRADSYKPHVSEFKIADMVEKTCMAFSEEIELKEVNIKHIDKTANTPIVSDFELLINCLKNIIENALRYSPKGADVVIESDFDDGNLRITVFDKGAGFSEKSLQHDFDLFISAQLPNVSEGFGLGLASAKLIMDTLSGKLILKNNENGGAMVSIVFPYDSE